MKTLKILFLLLAVTTITSTMGIKAQDYNDTNDWQFDLFVPAFNGGVSPLNRVKLENTKTQKLKYTITEPSNDDLDVIIRIKENNGSFSDATEWKIFRTGWDIDFNKSSDTRSYMLGAGRTFELYIDSRIHYTRATKAHGRWYVN